MAQEMEPGVGHQERRQGQSDHCQRQKRISQTGLQPSYPQGCTEPKACRQQRGKAPNEQTVFEQEPVHPAGKRNDR